MNDRQIYRVMDRASATSFGAQWRIHGNVFFVVNSSRAFLTHRATWALALQSAGARVTVVSSVDHVDDDRAIRELGFRFIDVDLGRESVNSATAAVAALRIFVLLVRDRPSVVFLSATAAYVLGWPAALVLRRTRFIRVIAGAGRALSADVSSGIRARLIGVQLRSAARLKNVLTVFQTSSDYNRFHDEGFARWRRSYIIRGTGIDLTTWSPVPCREMHAEVRILFASRLFREKGVYDFVELASELRERGNKATCSIVGATDRGVKSGVSLSELKSWEQRDVIRYLGPQDNMRSVYSGFDVLVFPTYHPEGTPRVLIEAAAMGLAIVFYDQDGCLEVLPEADEAIAVPAGELDTLIERVDNLTRNHEMMLDLGRAARLRMEKAFGLEKVLDDVCRLAGAVSLLTSRTTD